MSPAEQTTPTDLQRLADAYGVATSYQDYLERETEVPESTVRRVLEGLGVDVDDPSATPEPGAEQRLVPGTVVVRLADLGRLRAVSGCTAATLTLEDGVGDPSGGTSGVPVGDRELELDDGAPVLPADLPLGYHRLTVTAAGRRDEATLVVVPDRVPLPDGLSGAARAWGWMVQLYSVRSAGSWGMGDYADLAELARWSAAQGAGLLLVNPLHAVAPTYPVEPSPYFPASRRFSSPLYLRPELLAEHEAAGEQVRVEVARLRAVAAGNRPTGDRIDRDAVWQAKSAALEALFAHAVDRPGAEDSEGLRDFATYCALAEVHGRDTATWPQELHDPRGPAVTAEADRLAARVRFHTWLQHCCDEQLAAAQQVATDAGMPVGIVHDLAVGVDPGGADAWALRDDLAHGFSIGAPPDGFNQQGQDWQLPPWRPDRLVATGYQPVRDMVQAVLRKGGGIRVDHILGLYRLWWVPDGASSADGTYVRYDVDALLGIIALEAGRSGALVVGEDLGTVPPEMTAALERWGLLGSAVLWFEREDRREDDDGGDEDAFLPPARWRREVMGSVTTHDLPTAAGFLAGEHVRVRDELGVLGRPVAEEQAQADDEQAALRRMLAAQGLCEVDAPASDVVVAMHRVLGLSPARVVLAALGDAVGDLRQPNLPGTTDAYPNWRLAVADGDGRPLSLEDLQASTAVGRLARTLDQDVHAR